MAAASVKAPPRPGSRDALLDAVGELLADRTWARVKMADVAKVAKVSRQTLYNTFGSREGLALAYVSRESQRFLATIEATVVANANDPVRALSEALAVFLSAAETHPLVRAISASEQGDELLVLVTTGGGPVLRPLTERLSELIASTWPIVDRETTDLVADTLVRLAISHAALPGGAPAQVAEDVAQILGPFILIEARKGAERQRDQLSAEP
jgi:AcrR family transcriptional regulator